MNAWKTVTWVIVSAALTGVALAAEPAPQASAVAKPAPAKEEEEAPEAASEAKTWYVMLAVYEPRTVDRCTSWVYKVSTNDPMEIKGPETITPAHADAVINAWLGYLRARSPTAYKWINGSTGNHVNEIYFRDSEKEARRDFAAGGHMERDTSCGGSVLLKHGVSKFRFVPSEDFLREDFGAPKGPPPELAEAATQTPEQADSSTRK
ncbi:MAG: hypothetical protein AAF553_07840 [Pseudomonadota bacterium]